MDYSFFKGAAVGLALAAPVGPVGVLCVRRAISSSRMEAFVTGLGAAIADTIFGAIGGLGLVVISRFLFDHEVALGLIGAAILLGVGYVTFRTPIDLSDGSYEDGGLWADFVSAFSLTITNPATLAAAISLFAALGAVDGETHPFRAASLVLGIFVGSALWWMSLSLIGGVARGHAERTGLTWLNKVSGSLLLICGLAVVTAVIIRVV